MLRERTALKKVYRKGWQGSYMDSSTHNDVFHNYSPTNFGMIEGSMYASDSDSEIINRKWLWHTAAQGRMVSTEPGVNEYTWRMSEDPIADLKITRVDDNLGTTPGKNLTEFLIYADNGNFHEPVLLKTDSSDAPMLRILGKAEQVSPAEWKYRVRLQDGSPTAFIDPKWLQPNMRLIDGGTSTADELNSKYGGDSYANVFELQSHIGYVGRKIEMTDKAIRLEIRGNIQPYSVSGSKTQYTDGALGVGYIYQPGLADKTKSTKIEAGRFITMAEYRLGERLAEDKNFMMEFGRTEITTDRDTGRQIKVAPGYRQMRREGNFMPHNGSLTLQDLYERLQDIFVTREGVGGPEVVMWAGKGGIEMFNRMVKVEYGMNPFTLQDSYFVSRTSSKITPNALKYGAQFTECLMPNGVTLKVMYDPNKDNTRYYSEKVPGTNYTYESFCFDVLDLGDSASAPSGANTRSNIAMVYEKEYEEYYSISNVYDLRTGAIKDGRNASGHSKEAGIYRGSSVGLAIWDISRTMSLPYLG